MESSIMSHLYNKEIDFVYQRKDAFGRLRVSNPVTLFDSFNRYIENDKFHTANSATGSSTTFDANTSMVSMNVQTTSGNFAYRETKRVFAYQPGKSLLVLNTFVMGEGKSGLRQRVGYFGTQNGIFLELDGTTLNIVKRTNITSTPTDTPIPRNNWNYDRLDGNGPSGKTLDITKAQIFWIDIEWLGVGSVRTGFVIDGEYCLCHKFDHANILPSTYMTTACLPIRLEIENTSGTSSNSTLKQICSTVISEGGYQITGRPRSIGHNVISPYSMAVAGTFYPVAAIRLKANRPDCIVVPKAFSFLGISSGSFRIRLLKDAIITGGTWVDYGSDSNIEYNLTGTSFTGGIELSSAYTSTTNQGTGVINQVPDTFTFQLERNSFTSTPSIFLLAATGTAATMTACGAIDWQEIT
jgi:hypothetical protein